MMRAEDMAVSAVDTERQEYFTCDKLNLCISCVAEMYARRDATFRGVLSCPNDSFPSTLDPDTRSAMTYLSYFYKVPRKSRIALSERFPHHHMLGGSPRHQILSCR